MNTCRIVGQFANIDVVSFFFYDLTYDLIELLVRWVLHADAHWKRIDETFHWLARMWLG